MKKSGRPYKSASYIGWMLVRIGLVLFAYDRSRLAGQKREAAIQDAILHVQARHPEMPISRSVVQRILKEHRDPNRTHGLVVREEFEKPEDAIREWVVPDWFGPKEMAMLPPVPRPGTVIRKTVWSDVPIQRFPRSNARAAKPKSGYVKQLPLIVWA